jgi:hypothetical protein
MNGGANNPNEHNVDIRPDKILTVPQSTQCKIVGFPKDTGNTKQLFVQLLCSMKVALQAYWLYMRFLFMPKANYGVERAVRTSFSKSFV